MEMISTPSIMFLVLTIMSLLNLAFKKYPNFQNLIPLLSGFLGAILGLIVFYAIPSIIPTDNVFHSILMGLFSGLSTTGSTELVKQLKNLVDLKKESKTPPTNNPVQSNTPSIPNDAGKSENNETEKITESNK